MACNIIRTEYSDCDGWYLKWHNSMFGYSYYLFNSIAEESFKTKSLGDVREHFSWTDNYLDIGKKGQRKIAVFALARYEDREMFKCLAKSNEVYLYTGERYQQATVDTWLEVKIEDMKLKETNRNNSFEVKFSFRLPKEKTRTRI